MGIINSDQTQLRQQFRQEHPLYGRIWTSPVYTWEPMLQKRLVNCRYLQSCLAIQINKATRYHTHVIMDSENRHPDKKEAKRQTKIAATSLFNIILQLAKQVKLIKLVKANTLTNILLTQDTVKQEIRENSKIDFQRALNTVLFYAADRVNVTIKRYKY